MNTTKSFRQKVVLWIIAAVVMSSLVSFASPATQLFAGGECTQTTCTG